MKPTEKLYFLFTDTFYSNLILSFDSEIAFWTIKEFDGLNVLVCSITFCSIIFALLTNYFLGFALYSLLIKGKGSERLAQYEKIGSLWNKGYILLFFLCLIPNMLKLILVLCGFLRF